MSHEHPEPCEHNLAFCTTCEVPYCLKCDAQWAKPCNQIHMPQMSSAPDPFRRIGNTITNAPFMGGALYAHTNAIGDQRSPARGVRAIDTPHTHSEVPA